MRIRRSHAFSEQAASRVQRLMKDPDGLYVWFFHGPSGPPRVGVLLWNLLLKAAWFALAVSLPWLIAQLSFQVAHTICLVLVFIAGPLYLIFYWCKRFIPYIPPVFRHGLGRFTTVRDLTNVLAGVMFLISYPGALWNHLFEQKTAGEQPLEWLRFLGEQVLAVATGGAAADAGIRFSSIEPDKSVAAALVLAGLNILIAATLIQTLFQVVRWYRGGQLFTGSLNEAAQECAERQEVPDAYISRLGRLQPIPPEVYCVRTLGDQEASLVVELERVTTRAHKRFWPLLQDRTTFGRTAFYTLGVTHVGVESIASEATSPTGWVIAVSHRKFIPTAEIEARLDSTRAQLTLILNGNQHVTFAPQEVLRPIRPGANIQTVVLYEMRLMEVVGLRTCKLAIV